jgi:hypothetical protein
MSEGFISHMNDDELVMSLHYMMEGNFSMEKYCSSLFLSNEKSFDMNEVVTDLRNLREIFPGKSHFPHSFI